MAEAVYILCFLTSAAVALMLLRGYRKTKARILLWSSLGFIGLCINNLILIADLMLIPAIDLSIVRSVPALLGMMLLIYGLIWDSE